MLAYRCDAKRLPHPAPAITGTAMWFQPVYRDGERDDEVAADFDNFTLRRWGKFDVDVLWGFGRVGGAGEYPQQQAGVHRGG